MAIRGYYNIYTYHLHYIYEFSFYPEQHKQFVTEPTIFNVDNARFIRKLD